jgi:hypothetical protein
VSLHVVIGACIGFGMYVAMLVILGLGGADLAAIERASVDEEIAVAAGLSFWVLVLTSLPAWLLFVYLRTSTRTRAVVLIASAVIGVIASAALLGNALPHT